jgi:ABC-type Zn uptake system ZnuABC Zn-binding protein ZnuA
VTIYNHILLITVFLFVAPGCLVIHASENDLPHRIEQSIRLADDLGLNVIYAEELVDPRFAEAIAQEIPNSKVLVLSPLEGIEKEVRDTVIVYLDKMEENISNLKVDLECSI